MSPNYVPKASDKKRKPTSGARAGAHDDRSSNVGGCRTPPELSEQSSDGMVGQLHVKNTFIDLPSYDQQTQEQSPMLRCDGCPSQDSSPPAEVREQSSDCMVGQSVGQLHVKNTFIDDHPDLPRDDQKAFRRGTQTLPDVFDRNLDGFSEGMVKGLPKHMYHCFVCKHQCPEGWQRGRGKFHFCCECLLKGKKKAPSIATSSSPGGPAVWEEEPDPISADPSSFRTQVDVVRGDCLEAMGRAHKAHKAEWSVGLLVFGIKEGPLIVHEEEGQGKRVLDQTTMRQAVRDTERPDRGVSKSGSIRVPQVALCEDPGIRFHALYTQSPCAR